MGKLKSINTRLPLALMALLLIIIAAVNTPFFQNHPLVFSVLLFILGALCIMGINLWMKRSLNFMEKEMENRINEKATALEAASRKLEAAMKELDYTRQKVIHRETQKSLTSIVSGFAHEINNPLTGILGYIDLMEMNNDLSPYSRKRLEKIKDQAVRIKEIIAQLNWLDPELEQVKSDINLANLLEKMIKIIFQGEECRGIEFEKEFADEEIMVSGNHFALWQVFEGITENAIEAIKERNIKKGKIRVVLKKSADGKFSIVEFIDNGGGFEKVEKALNPFYTTKPRTQKRGIGLSIAFNVVQEHDGNILIDNHENGAIVAVHLPLSDDFLEKTENKTNTGILHKNSMPGGY
jgi:signal transduction histidine kinase